MWRKAVWGPSRAGRLVHAAKVTAHAAGGKRSSVGVRLWSWQRAADGQQTGSNRALEEPEQPRRIVMDHEPGRPGPISICGGEPANGDGAIGPDGQFKTGEPIGLTGVVAEVRQRAGS
jgi:hypothetical protein